MDDVGVQDLRSLDRDVARGVALLADWRARLALDPWSCEAEEPLEPVRRVAGKATWDALGALETTVADRPLCDGLRAWVYALLQARVGRADEVAWAIAASDPVVHVDGEGSRRVAWRHAWRGVVAAKTAGEANRWLVALADAGPGLAAASRLRAERRVEVARRLGLQHPWEPVVGLAPAVLRATASSYLDATEELSRSLHRHAFGAEAGPAAVIHAAVARDAGEGWPARLGPRWLHEVLAAAFDGPPLDLSALPTPFGGSSFARALCAFGFAARDASAPASMPFALAREPGFVGAHRLGFVTGALAADPEFYTRALGLGRGRASSQARVLAMTALLDSRLHAARVLLGDESALAPRDAFEEVGARLFGRPLDERLRGAWPPTRHDEPARWLALLEAPGLSRSLRETFDVDWFRNPRAWTTLRAALPAREPVDEALVRSGVDALARWFEEALA